MTNLITGHALEGSLSVDAELILTLALFSHLALVNVLREVQLLIGHRLGEVLTYAV